MTNEILAELRALMLNPPTDDIWARFCSFIDPQSWTDCWEWRDRRAVYGRFRAQPFPNRRAHRWILSWVHGELLPTIVVDHLWCDNTLCVNPLHLLPTTHANNVLRGKGSPAMNARKTRCLNGHPLTLDNIDLALLANYGQRQCRQCRRARAKITRAKDPERFRRYCLDWKYRNLEQQRAYGREYQRLKRARERGNSI